METLWDGTNHASLSYSQGRACPSPSHTNPPRCASDSAITSRWFKGKKHTCQESAKTFRVASHHCGHQMDIPQGQFDLSPHAAPSSTQHPPGLAHLPLHCLHWCSWRWEISWCWGISQHSPERDPTGGAGTDRGWFLVRGQRQSRSVSWR